jgi:hypothetical protein
MTEFIKDFIKFIAEVILIFLLLVTLFGDQGVIANTMSFVNYAEPNLVKDYLATALTVGSYAPGEFFSSARISGNPYEIKLYKENGVNFVFVNVQPSLLNAKFSQLQPTKFLSSCNIDDVTIKIEKRAAGTITVKNDLTNGCNLTVIT